ncbi:hypothetical protein C7974DRAFT_428796 [Boeremia exigua]|uniref:uncharacterized protein n=1 Tax=Boeremia exigua TaxID=749465 RepID=UPI001E8CDF4F|nr:uncharacterized protein C7974DRAFT_428796 [Boeremia exigua]KAH6613077.1 hypothetical protein C7974DRAFT_428796 [Boeremia exigua]
MTNPRPKDSVPVLAYLSSQPLSQSCRMRIFHNNDSNLSIALYVTVTLHRAAEQQVFVMQYDADNHRENRPAASHPPISKHIPIDRLAEYARHVDPETTTLTLSLMQPAPVWCPRDQIMAPQASADSVVAFDELVELARATTVHLVFDYKWLTGAARAAVQRLIKGKLALHGFPLTKYFAKTWERKDWTHFAPASATAHSPTPEASNKRARSVSGLSTPSPPAKRPLADNPIAPSPTEVASSPPEYAKPGSEADYQTLAIRRVVLRELPAILASTLPAVLPTIFAVPDSDINCFASDASTFSKLELTAAGAAFVPHLVAHLQPQIQDLMERAMSRTGEQREAAMLEFEEHIDDLRLGLVTVKEDGEMEMMRMIDEKTEGLQQDLEDEGNDIAFRFSAEVSSAADDIANAAAERFRQRLEALERQALKSLIKNVNAQPFRTLVECELARQLGRPDVRGESRSRGVRKAKGGCRAQGRRERTSDQPLRAWQKSHRDAERQLRWLLCTGQAHPTA